MRIDYAEDLVRFIEELKKEIDRGLLWIGTVLIDERLRNTSEAFFIEGKSNSKLLDPPQCDSWYFSSRLDLCWVLG